MVWFFLFLVLVVGGLIIWGMVSPQETQVTRRAPGPSRDDRQYLAEEKDANPWLEDPAPRSHEFVIRAKIESQDDLSWVAPGQQVRTKGFEFTSPGVYVSKGKSYGNQWATDPSEIILNAPVRAPRGGIEEMGYWPWYSRIEPEQRYVYLQWLASNRKALPPLEGLLFLYYYGIERRLLVDQEDLAWGMQEIIRLRQADAPRVGTKEGRSFRRYSTSHLWYHIGSTPARFNREAFERSVKLTHRWSAELLTAPLAWLVHHSQPLPASFAEIIASELPGAQCSVVTKRVPEEFSELFRNRYHEEYGEHGIDLRVSKREALLTYRPASSALQEWACKVPNPMGIRSQFKKLPDIWNSCIEDLRKLSRVTLSTPDDEMTVEYWEALPVDIRQDIDHPLSRQLGELMERERIELKGAGDDTIEADATLVRAGPIAELAGIEQRPTLTPTQSRRLAETLGFSGYGIVPDARITSHKYGWDDPVAIISIPDEDEVDSARYNAAACVLRLGLSIALADGHPDELEIRVLTDYIEAAFSLSPVEEQRLIALRALLVHSGCSIRSVARKLENLLPLETRRSLAKTLVLIAAETNGIDRSEMAALRKAIRALGLEPDVLESTLIQLGFDPDAPVTVKPSSRSRAWEEPLPAHPHSSFTLDRQAISDILTETRQVSRVLAEAMESDDDFDFEDSSHEDDATHEPEDHESIELGRYAPLYKQLIKKEHWSSDEIDQLSSDLGLMRDAAIEAINDWSFDALGDPLIDEVEDGYTIDHSIL